MSAPNPSPRRLAIATGVAAASATLAIGITAASLFGWFSPAGGTPAESPTAMTVEPAPPPVAATVAVERSPRRHGDEDHEREGRREHHHDDDDDDDDDREGHDGD